MKSCPAGTASSEKPLSAIGLVRQFGAGSAMACEGIASVLGACSPAARRAENDLAWERLPRLLARPAARYGVSDDPAAAAALLVALRAYYALLVKQFLQRLVPDSNAEESLFPLPPRKSAAIARFQDRLATAVAAYDLSKPPEGLDGHCDVFKPLYHDLFPRPLRRQLGEYYTPDWLAQHVLDQVAYEGQSTKRLLDPACGSGTFLLMAIRRLRRSHEAKKDGNAGTLLASLPVGFDLNPLAVLTARANYLLALADLLPQLGRFQPPVHLCDSILHQRKESQFDYVVGNPPWIAWDNLPTHDREATKPLWEKYGLFSLSGVKARHGGGKKDLSMLMLYVAADRYLKPGGRLGMVITQTLFQTLGAGDGFRRFQLGPDGPPLRVLRVDDLTALKPFGDAANWTSTILLEKGVATRYPVPYFRWTEHAAKAKNGRHGSRFQQQAYLARPIDPAAPTSPWLVRPDAGDHQSLAIPSPGPSDYTAHLGANTGGANGVYWLEVLGETRDGVRVRNVAARGKHRVEGVERVIEPELLYPLLRWGGVRRYRAIADGCLLLAQDPATRSGIDETTMRARWPRTLGYLERFRPLLAARAAYRRYQHAGPFYSMYNVGVYTTAPIKVVWRRMDRRINAAVVQTARQGAGTKPILPQETCVLVACDSVDEAHYLCGMLNSDSVNRLVTAHSVRGGKSFGTPGMLNFVPLRRFRPEDPVHRRICCLSRQAHSAMLEIADERSADLAVEPFQQEIDRVAATLLPQ